MIDGSLNARIDCETPASFVERLAAGLRLVADGKRSFLDEIRTGYSEVPMIAGRVDMLAGYVSSVPLWDSRLRALMVISGVMRDPDNPSRWVPGTEQQRVLSGLGTNGEFKPDYALTELTAAGAEDVIRHGVHRVAMAESERDRFKTEVEELWSIKVEYDAAKRRLDTATMTREVDLANAARSARLAVLQAVEAEQDPAHLDDAVQLPKGVRPRGDRFEALLYKSESPDGKQKGLGIYATVSEAEAARAARLSEPERVAA